MLRENSAPEGAAWQRLITSKLYMIRCARTISSVTGRDQLDGPKSNRSSQLRRPGQFTVAPGSGMCEQTPHEAGGKRSHAKTQRREENRATPREICERKIGLTEADAIVTISVPLRAFASSREKSIGVHVRTPELSDPAQKG